MHVQIQESIFRYISRKLGAKMYILLFSSCIKFHTLLKYQQKSQGLPFIGLYSRNGATVIRTVRTH